MFYNWSIYITFNVVFNINFFKLYFMDLWLLCLQHSCQNCNWLFVAFIKNFFCSLYHWSYSAKIVIYLIIIRKWYVDKLFNSFRISVSSIMDWVSLFIKNIYSNIFFKAQTSLIMAVVIHLVSSYNNYNLTIQFYIDP